MNIILDAITYIESVVESLYTGPEKRTDTLHHTELSLRGTKQSRVRSTGRWFASCLLNNFRPSLGCRLGHDPTKNFNGAYCWVATQPTLKVSSERFPGPVKRLAMTDPDALQANLGLKLVRSSRSKPDRSLL